MRLRNPHSIVEAFRKRPQSVKSVTLPSDTKKLGDAWQEIETLAARNRIPVRVKEGRAERPKKHSSQKRSGGQEEDRRDQASAEVADFPRLEIEDLFTEDDQVLLALDCVQDPQNLGAILRTAAFFGVGGVIVPSDRAASLTDLAVDVASGGPNMFPWFR